MEQSKEKKVILLLFFASGISGLIYEVVWLRILSRIIGVTTYATAITLAAFMFGLAFGSYLFGKLADKRKDHLRIYALLQLLVAVVAITTPILLKISIPLYKYIYEISNHNSAVIGTARVLVCFICLLVPTTLMGGTLPVLTSYLVRKERLFGKIFSLLYGLNTLGAVLGVLLSGFITIGAIGEWNTIFIGVLINFIVGGISLLLYKVTRAGVEEAKAGEDEFAAAADVSISPYSNVVRKTVLAVILISGFTALSYEVIWTRHLILFLKNSIYAFSGMLAVFLTGVATGSIFINKFVDRFKAPLVVFGIFELLVGALSMFNLHLFGSLDSRALTRILAPVILVFPLTFIFGAIFPVASLCYAKSVNRSGSSVGVLYAFNTIGNVAGSLLTGFVFISLLGSSNTVLVLGFVNIALGLLLVQLEPNKPGSFKLKFLLIIPIAIFLSLGFKGQDPFLNAIERRIAYGAKELEIFYNRETIEGTLTVYERDGDKRMRLNGVGQTRLCTETKMMAHLPIMLSKEPKTFLAICFGMGTTVKSASIYDDLSITSVELVPEMYECFKYYHKEAEEISSKENVELITGDGRNFLLLSSDKYDVISVDPSPPIYTAGTVNLYTQEFLTLCKEHLRPDGVMCLWLPMSLPPDSLSVVKTFYSVFPNMTVWKGAHGWGYHLVGTVKETNIDKAKIEKAFTNPRLVEDLSEYDDSCVSSAQLLDLLLLHKKSEIEDATKDSVITTDDFPYTEFPLWRYVFSKLKSPRSPN